MGRQDEGNRLEGPASEYTHASNTDFTPTLTLVSCVNQFQKSHADDIKRQGRSDTLHAGAYMGYYPDNGTGTGWYDDQGRVACPFPATPKDNHDGLPKPSGVRRKVR